MLQFSVLEIKLIFLCTCWCMFPKPMLEPCRGKNKKLKLLFFFYKLILFTKWRMWIFDIGLQKLDCSFGLKALFKMQSHFCFQSWFLWLNTPAFSLRGRLHNLEATSRPPTEKWDGSGLLYLYSSLAPASSLPHSHSPREAALIMFSNTKLHSKFVEHESHERVETVWPGL